jgi:hypothetical protein
MMMRRKESFPTVWGEQVNGFPIFVYDVINNNTANNKYNDTEAD